MSYGLTIDEFQLLNRVWRRFAVAAESRGARALLDRGYIEFLGGSSELRITEYGRYCLKRALAAPSCNVEEFA